MSPLADMNFELVTSNRGDQFDTEAFYLRTSDGDPVRFRKCAFFCAPVQSCDRCDCRIVACIWSGAPPHPPHRVALAEAIHVDVLRPLHSARLLPRRAYWGNPGTPEPNLI